MDTSGRSFRRLDKRNHSDTIVYEMYMMRFTAGELSQGKFEKDAWVYLESFLVHFRNLIEFLGNDNPRKRDTRTSAPYDLQIRTFWEEANLTEPDNVNEIVDGGYNLFRSYERGNERISRFLAHCTSQRIDFKEWRINEMCEQIEPLLSRVEEKLNPSPDFRAAIKRVSAINFSGTLPASAAISISTTTAVVVVPPADEELIP